ncbi:hypothetical protein [Thioclava sp. F28-4]|uniref:hypothetical protein n=1 Tax=Thioclava sp. F28-4 TaxID=1915315 RepID=UPI0011BAD7DD|nr:hypothetical protein [Thioclava sp. F28-4]
MKSEKNFSFDQRAAEKAAARAQDECDIRSGAASAAQIARENGGGRREIKLIGRSERMRKLASFYRNT